MSKELILSIETSTAMCSVALSSEGKVLEHRSDSLRRHASLTSVFCKEVLDAAGVSPHELSAVCISDGPGSYTGLRVGLSTAKGICFGAGVKLLSVSSLDVLAAMAANAFGAKGNASSCSTDALGGNAGFCPTDALGGVANASASETIAANAPVAEIIAANESGRNVGFGSNALGGNAGFCPTDALSGNVGSCSTDALGGVANASATEIIAAKTIAANASAAEIIAASAANESGRNVGFGSNAFGGNAGSCPTDALSGNVGSCSTDALSGVANASASETIAANASVAETIAASAANESGKNVGFGSNALSGVAGFIVPMIDARRMEVFCARYDATGLKRLSEVEAVVVDEKSFADIAPQALFIGDGAMKCREVIGAGQFVEAFPDAAAMAALAHREYAAGNWRDVAYFEPFYLKDFVATVSKKKLF